VVGVQPFGGEGLSGTGPKAGGPHYLPRFATEKTVTINTTAAGGNASLLTLRLRIASGVGNVLPAERWRVLGTTLWPAEPEHSRRLW
jgi:hypothetical protein